HDALLHRDHAPRRRPVDPVAEARRVVEAGGLGEHAVEELVLGVHAPDLVVAVAVAERDRAGPLLLVERGAADADPAVVEARLDAAVVLVDDDLAALEPVAPHRAPTIIRRASRCE